MDRLGSAQDDERIWAEEDMNNATASTPSTIPATVGGFWAADTLQKREKNLRSNGRILWSFAIAKDWVTSRLSGSCMIHPSSFNTTSPTPYSHGGSITEEDSVVWSFSMSASYITLKYHDLCVEAQALGKRVPYDKVLELDAELMNELQRRPNWLRAEGTVEGEISSSPLGWEAIMISCTFWHRLFALVSLILAQGRHD